jgi:hypothetical protein
VPQPKWWDKLPLVPFMEICSFLDYKQVFGRLRRACKHFNQLIDEEGQVGFNKISVSNPSAAHLNKLKDKSIFLQITRRDVGLRLDSGQRH